MKEKAGNTDHLAERLDMLMKKQAQLQLEIRELGIDIAKVNAKQEEIPADKNETSGLQGMPEEPASGSATLNMAGDAMQKQASSRAGGAWDLSPEPRQSRAIKSNLEKFIGENLISKIGIVITVIGIAIGTKYSIEHQLISPLTRVILAYLTGLVLLGIGVKLKKNYLTYSAVLVSGAMAIMYFITFIAYSLYGLIPQTAAFALMVVITACTVYAALNYNLQVIGHIGLVGAYAVPFLLSDGSGRVEILFSYMCIINIGILIIAFKKYWKPIYYSSFFLSWIIFLLWFTTDYTAGLHFKQAFVFQTIFFVIFYVMFLANKLMKQSVFELEDIILLMANSFVFYAIGYSLLDNHMGTENMTGFFTLCNAIFHGCVAVLVYFHKQADRKLFYFVSGLVLVFLTIAIPVQLDGSWVTLLWAGEASVLFWVGRTKSSPFCERLSYVMMVFAFISLVHGWSIGYEIGDFHAGKSLLTPVLNIHFLTSMLFIAAFGFINILDNKFPKPGAAGLPTIARDVVSLMIPGILMISLYFAFRLEISHYWEQYSGLSVMNPSQGDEEISTEAYFLSIEAVWVINYSMFYLCLLSLLNIRFFRSSKLAGANTILNVVAMVLFLFQGLFVQSELREGFLNHALPAGYQSPVVVFGLRYLSIAISGFLLLAVYRYLEEATMGLGQRGLKPGFDIFLHTAILWIVSSELITWMDIAGFSQSYKLGLSILWGVYALLMIALGIWRSKKHLRYCAIGLFGGTLIKLFFYDIASLDTIAKTILFVSLGILLLIISFLYHKYKHLITPAESPEAD